MIHYIEPKTRKKRERNIAMVILLLSTVVFATLFIVYLGKLNAQTIDFQNQISQINEKLDSVNQDLDDKNAEVSQDSQRLSDQEDQIKDLQEKLKNAEAEKNKAEAKVNTMSYDPCLDSVRGGVGNCHGHKLTYYNLNMSAFGSYYTDKKGFKRRASDNKIEAACATKYRGQEIVKGLVCVDTGSFAKNNPEQIDIALNA